MNLFNKIKKFFSHCWNGNVELCDSLGNIIYYEDQSGFWFKQEFNNNKRIYYEDSDVGIIIDKRRKIKE